MVLQNTVIQKRVVRLGQILKIFFEKDKIYTSSLAKILKTNIRSIQRDLKLLREAGFPINEVTKGCHRLEKNLFKNFELFDESELGLVIALRNLVTQLGPTFQGAADSVFNRLYKSITNYSSLPVYIKVDKPVIFESRLFNRLIKAIRTMKTVSFDYKLHLPYEVTVEPYKVAYFNGFWYLVGKDLKKGEIKRYAIDKIEQLRMLSKTFRAIPKDLDVILEGSANIWFSAERNLEVVVLVDQSCADYFKRKNMFPTQKIMDENPDGSLVVSFKVGRFEEVRDLIKTWLPHMKILKPGKYKKEFIKDIRKWIVWQEKNTY